MLTIEELVVTMLTCANPMDKWVAEKMIVLAGMLGNKYLFEKASMRIIQKFVSENKRTNILNFRMLILNELGQGSDAAKVCRSYTEMFDLRLFAAEIQGLDIADILAQGLPVLDVKRDCPHQCKCFCHKEGSRATHIRACCAGQCMLCGLFIESGRMDEHLQLCHKIPNK